MLSVRVVAALARSLPWQAGLVSALSSPWAGEWGVRVGVAAILEAVVTLRDRGLPLSRVCGYV